MLCYNHLEENVRGMTIRPHRGIFKTIIKMLKDIGYNVSWSILRTQDHGMSHSRARLYIVGIRNDSQRHEFVWPKPVPLKRTAKQLLLRDPQADRRLRLPLSPKHKALVKNAYRTAMANGHDPRRAAIITDIGCSPRFACHGVGQMPCMTATRCQQMGFWISVVGRKVNLLELFQFQGIDHDVAEDIMETITASQRQLKKIITDAKVGHMLGNTMSLNVIERVLLKALPAAGLALAKNLVDRWDPCVTATSSGLDGVSLQLILLRQS